MKNYIIITVLISVLGAGCTKTLELEPISTISTASFWKTEDDANGALRGMYIRLRSVTAANLYLWGEARSQNLKQSVGNDFTNLRTFNNTLDPTAAGPDWSSVYRVINDVNLILKYLPNISFKTEAARNRALAEAYTMRAYCYFIMAKTWGDIPLVTDPTEGYDPSVIYKERTSASAIFTQIKADITQGLSLFPDNSFLPGRNRWSKPALNVLKGDVYLWTAKKMNGGNEDFTTALTALSDVETADVQLLDNFERIFDYDNKGNKEILMANNFQQFESGATFMANMYLDAFPPNSDPDAVAIIGALGGGGGNYWTLTDETRNKFKAEDSRRVATYTELYSFEESTGDYTKFYGCIQRKFNGFVNAGSRLFIDDVVLYRYADVLLMKAEAQNALGQDPSDAVNAVRERAFGSNFSGNEFVAGSQEDNDEAILEERLLEFLYEGKYWWDILRFNKASESIPYFIDNPTHTYKYLWPLSLSILSTEPKAVQNPGYN
ncbi:RagB/SusD family nutrient uptake outer membrane protein [Agriterribacter sp.]|uniref:RagB/SusD family nutrient uptake outer membrane protein n=1 Tax=Agriterribacter sp. TaxID=2821509 RepID=UPI002C121E93|nr:RagB/SusD family nutrient uptake outer membrane protein [Agriterribacter sp.]HRO46528.1 RagB/SusD family nutrient uptake outer membrane protein [Agriterribacter sp.]HRQ17543.1 RagB/SusD family nutrient uptake outer membrane protein [Agriterribacter sp.]